MSCALCNSRPNSIDHLFFGCHVSTVLASFWAAKCNIPWQNISWMDNLMWATKFLSRSDFYQAIARFSFGALCHVIWKTRNNILFRAKPSLFHLWSNISSKLSRTRLSPSTTLRILQGIGGYNGVGDLIPLSSLLGQRIFIWGSRCKFPSCIDVRVAAVSLFLFLMWVGGLSVDGARSSSSEVAAVLLSGFPFLFPFLFVAAVWLPPFGCLCFVFSRRPSTRYDLFVIMSASFWSREPPVLLYVPLIVNGDHFHYIDSSKLSV